MNHKKQSYNDDEIPIYNEAVVYGRGEYWQMRMWLSKKKKYVRFSSRTRNRDTATDKAEKHYHELMGQQSTGKTYFSKIAKQGHRRIPKAEREGWLYVAAGNDLLSVLFSCRVAG